MYFSRKQPLRYIIFRKFIRRSMPKFRNSSKCYKKLLCDMRPVEFALSTVRASKYSRQPRHHYLELNDE